MERRIPRASMAEKRIRKTVNEQRDSRAVKTQ
jgi:hypothetical protein